METQKQTNESAEMNKVKNTVKIDYSSPIFLAKAEREARKCAKGEPVRVELVDSSGRSSAYIVWTSELGMYRVWDAYTNGGECRHRTTKGKGTKGFYVVINN